MNPPLQDAIVEHERLVFRNPLLTYDNPGGSLLPGGGYIYIHTVHDHQTFHVPRMEVLHSQIYAVGKAYVRENPPSK